MRNLFMTFVSVICFMVFSSGANATTPAVPTNIINLDKVQFIGALVIANQNSNAANSIKPTPDNLVIGFRDMESCQAFVDNFNLTFKIEGHPHSTTQSSWETQAYSVLVGSCVVK